jgi:hypothetical protein
MFARSSHKTPRQSLDTRIGSVRERCFENENERVATMQPFGSAAQASSVLPPTASTTFTGWENQ